MKKFEKVEKIGYHSNFNFECNTESGSKESLSIALGNNHYQRLLFHINFVFFNFFGSILQMKSEFFKISDQNTVRKAAASDQIGFITGTLFQNYIFLYNYV